MHDFTTLNNFFDNVYVITLQSAIERQEAIKKNLEGLAYEFFIGADKKDHSIQELIQTGIYDETLAKKNHRYHKTFSSGQVCCAWSHKKVYEDVISKGYKKVLIFEDDVSPTKHLEMFPKIIEDLPANWELLYLDYNKNEKGNSLKQNWYHIQRFFGGITWNHTTIKNLYPKDITQHIATAGYHDYADAYAITISAAEKLIQLQTPISYLADNLLPTAATTEFINGFIAKPKLFSQLSQGPVKMISSFIDD